jgi:hypothetical protein
VDGLARSAPDARPLAAATTDATSGTQPTAANRGFGRQEAGCSALPEHGMARHGMRWWHGAAWEHAWWRDTEWDGGYAEVLAGWMVCWHILFCVPANEIMCFHGSLWSSGTMLPCFHAGPDMVKRHHAGCTPWGRNTTVCHEWCMSLRQVHVLYGCISLDHIISVCMYLQGACVRQRV